MKLYQLSLTLIFLFIVQDLYSQSCVISSNHEYLLTMYNYMDISVEDIPFDSLLVKSSNGKVELINDAFRITPTKPGTAIISVYQKKQNDTLLIKKKMFQVEDFSQFSKATIQNKSNGFITKSSILAAHGIRAQVYNLDINISFNITHYQVFIVRNGITIFTQKGIEGRFNEKIKKALNATVSGDRIYFVDIKANQLHGEDQLILNNIILDIK